MNLTFYGAAKTVTGSCTMVEVAGKKFLVDCGMFQGKMTDQMLNYDDFPFDVNDIDFMILTHAHIDHSGRIPKLYKAGYTGPIYATTATVDLCSIMLADSGHIQEKEIEWVNKKRRRAGKKENEPMYTAQDGIDSMKLFKGVDYNQKITINENISFTLIDAGHMLGSSIVLLDLTEDGETKRVVFTGDLGNKNMPIIKDPTYIEGADHLIMESTYGNRLHGKMENQSEKFIDILLRTIERGGNVIIPSFAVGRTQEILYEINKYAAKEGYAERLKKIPVYVDSPLAVNATKIFEENPEYYDEEALDYLMKGDNPIDFDVLHLVTTSDESKALNDDPTPKVIISASGMCEVGRIKHHLKHNLYRPECTVLFVGYQATGTLGEKIQTGSKIVKIFGEEIAVKAEIEYLDAFSGHADRDGLLEFIEKMQNKPHNIFINHGEIVAQQVLKTYINEKFNIPVTIPGYEDTYTIDGEFVGTKQLTYKSTRFDILEMLSYLKQDVDDVSNMVKSEIKTTVDTNTLKDIYQKLDEVKKALGNTRQINRK